ncbi:MAG: hypothetical protein ACOX9R_05475 [Armatimonadota bacterium]
MSETILPRAGPEDFEFYARAGTHTFCSAVCDQVQLVVNQIPDHVMPYEWYVVRFYRYEDGVWVQKQSGGLTWNAELGLHAIHEWDTSVDPNESVQWRAELELDEVGMWPPEIIVLNLYDTWTPDNTVVKAAGPDLILHDAEDTSHTISWDLTHYPGLNTFMVEVTIHDLAGNVVETITRMGEDVGDGSVDWDENLPAASGIYTYRIVAEHDLDPPPIGACGDSDKSARLEITNVTVSDFEWTNLPTKAQVTLDYELSRDAAECTLKIYNHDLQVVETLPLNASLGSHTFAELEFEDPGQIVGDYRFVISAKETADDGELNRDRLAKPALQKGATQTVLPPAFNFYGGGSRESEAADGCSAAKSAQENPDAYASPPYCAEVPQSVLGANALHSRWLAQATQPDVESDALIAYFGHGNSGPDQTPYYSYLSLNGVADGTEELRGGRTADSPQDDPANGIRYICNLPDDAFQHVHLITFMGCLTACHTPADWEQDPDGCGCVAHAARGRGARCVIGFPTEIENAVMQWGVYLWDWLNAKGAVSIFWAAASAEDQIKSDLEENEDFDEDDVKEVMSQIQGRFIDGDDTAYLRPARWALEEE